MFDHQILNKLDLIDYLEETLNGRVKSSHPHDTVANRMCFGILCPRFLQVVHVRTRGREREREREIGTEKEKVCHCDNADL